MEQSEIGYFILSGYGCCEGIDIALERGSMQIALDLIATVCKVTLIVIICSGS